MGIEVARWLGSEGRRPPRGVGKFEGRIDLRGFAFPDARQAEQFRAGQLSFQSIRWRGIDFTGAVIRSARLFNSTIENCRFDLADLFDWRLWECRITDSSFVEAGLQGSAIGTGDRIQNGLNIWTQVNFDRADLAGATIVECIFRQCTFRRTRLRNLWFSFVTFDGVVFEGALDRVLFEGRKIAGKRDPGPMRNVDFRGVTFRHCDFRCQLENVTFDESPEIRVIRDFPAVLVHALGLAQESNDPEERDLTSLIEDMTTLKSELPYDSVFFPAEYASDDLRRINEAFGRLVDRAEADLKRTGSKAVPA